jgi:hypothetical protein
LRSRTWKTLTGAIGIAALTGILPVGNAAADGPHHDGTGFKTVATGLDNPRGLSFRSNGELIVGEAGHAGDAGCFEGGPEGTTCIGFTSQISAINVKNGTHWPIVRGLVSLGDGPIGPTGVDGVATRGNKVYGIMTASPQGAPPDEACADATCVNALHKAKNQVGKLIRVKGPSSWHRVASVGKYNYNYIVANKDRLGIADNPDFQPGDANPYAMAAGPHGTFYVVDGGSNTLDLVKPNGKIKVLAYLPDPPGPPDMRFPYDAVPTCVAVTEHGVVVGDLAGRVWNYSHGALEQMKVPDGMLHSTNGCAVDADGNVYVVDMFAGFSEQFGFAPNTGSVVMLGDDGETEVIAMGLNLPSGIAIGHDGAIYVSNNGVCPADITGLPPELCPSSGEVVRLDHRAQQDGED